MEIDISGRHFQVTPPLRDYAREKVSRLDKFSLKLESAHVIMAVEKIRHICEIALHGKNLRVAAKEQSTDMYAAFDKCLGTLQLRLGRRHDRVKDHKARRYSVKGRAKLEE